MVGRKFEKTFVENDYSGEGFHKEVYGIFDFVEKHIDLKVKLNEPYATFKISRKIDSLGGFEIGGTIDTGGEKELFANLINCRF